MTRAERIILEIQELPLDELKQIVEYVDSLKVDDFQPTQYSSDDMKLLDKDLEEARKGIHMSPTFQNADDAIAFLHQSKETT